METGQPSPAREMDGASEQNRKRRSQGCLCCAEPAGEMPQGWQLFSPAALRPDPGPLLPEDPRSPAGQSLAWAHSSWGWWALAPPLSHTNQRGVVRDPESAFSGQGGWSHVAPLGGLRLHTLPSGCGCHSPSGRWEPEPASGGSRTLRIALDHRACPAEPWGAKEAEQSPDPRSAPPWLAAPWHSPPKPRPRLGRPPQAAAVLLTFC